MTRRTLVAVCISLALVVGLTLGIVIGYFSAKGGAAEPPGAKLTREANESIAQLLLENIKAENIKQFLRHLASEPHLAGTEADYEQARYIRDTWLDQGLDTAELVSYDVLLSYPDSQRPNKVSVVDEQGNMVFHSAEREATLSPDIENPDVVPPFNAFAPSGQPISELVYVNYGRAEDFQQLDKLGISCSGKIALARYGRIFRGDKLNHAHKAGAVGLILYSDPADYTSATDGSVYPESQWLPPTGVQRGNVVTRKGDQLTPGYPATRYAYRLSGAKLLARLPQIPCQPIGYGDALRLLGDMGGPVAPPLWHGGLNVTYRLGPGFTPPHHKRKVRLEVYNKNERRTTYNVIGKVIGAVEPDRYVLLGDHRDAWAFGAVDPTSGTAAMMEITRVFGQLLKEGWRPRRTILFCSWGAEEYGLVGSTEWVEENVKILQARAVAYLNVDGGVRSNFSLHARASPLLRGLLLQSARKIPDPFDESLRLYDSWRLKDPAEASDRQSPPRVTILGSGSDFAPFIQQAGVAVTDHRYYVDRALKLSSYPLYHTGYDTLYLMEQHIDPDYRCHVTVAQLWAEMARHLADSLVLPLNAVDYAHSLKEFLDQLATAFGDKMENNGVALDALESAVNNFTSAAKQFHNKENYLHKSNPLDVRRYNDRLMLLERAFLDPAGLPGAPLYRHIIFAPSSRNTYGGSSFPGLDTLLYDIENASNPDEKWDAVKQHLSVIVFTIQSAADTLQ